MYRLSNILLTVCCISFLNLFEADAQNSMLTGLTTADEILASDKLLQIHHDRYQPDSMAVAYLTSLSDSATVYVFFGSWCRESRKYLPGFIKSMSVAQPAQLRIFYVGVGAQKKVPELFLKKYNIKYIPTVIVINGKKEIGRIIEAPNKPIEQTLVEILKKEFKF